MERGGEWEGLRSVFPVLPVGTDREGQEGNTSRIKIRLTISQNRPNQRASRGATTSDQLLSTPSSYEAAHNRWVTQRPREPGNT